MKILVSRCLLGENCRYKGDNCKNEKVIALGKEHELIGVCPETEGDLFRGAGRYGRIPPRGGDRAADGETGKRCILYFQGEKPFLRVRQDLRRHVQRKTRRGQRRYQRTAFEKWFLRKNGGNAVNGRIRQRTPRRDKKYLKTAVIFLDIPQE